MILDTDKFDEALAYLVNGATREWHRLLAEFIRVGREAGLKAIKLGNTTVPVNDVDLRAYLEQYYDQGKMNVTFIFDDTEKEPK